MTEPNVTDDGRTITVRVPIAFTQARRPEAGRRARRHQPPHRRPSPQVDNAMVKAHRPGVPVAEDAGERRVRDHRGNRRGGEDQ